jgi:hypothetical protein
MADQHPDSPALDEHLDLYQALAWVRFRNVEFAANATHETLSAEKFGGKREPVAGYRELQSALRTRQLIARGEMPSGEWEPIPSPKWEVLDIAPLDFSRNAPYVTIKLASADLLLLFPALGETTVQTKAAVVRKGKRGRTKGAGSLADADAPLLEEMRRLLADKAAFSVDDAAKRVAAKAAGHGTFDSKFTRLARRYRVSEQN